MPIYEYECQGCGHIFEVKQRFDDQPLTSCKICKGNLRKVIHAPGIQFKGGGWYVTDHPSADRKKCMENESKENKPSSTKKDEPAPSSSSCCETPQ